MIQGIDGRQIHAKTCGGPDQAGAAHMHVLNGRYDIVHATKLFDDKLVGELPLINNQDVMAILRVYPDGPEMVSINIHDREAVFSF